MKKIYITIALAFAILSTENTFAQQGFGTNQPDRSAAVDIVSSQRGLLIPRISINDLDQAAPVNQPANALFVYNTNSATGEGFYYWERDDKTLPTPATYSGRWVRFTSSINEKDVVVAAGDNVQVDPTISTDGLTTTYTVGVQGGSKDGQVLVTKIDNTDPANPVTTTEWTDPNTFVLDVLTAGNAIGIAADPNDPTKVEVKFNGTLSEDTTIETGTHNLSIKGLDDVTAMAADDKLVIMDDNGLLKTISKASLVDAKNLTLGDGLAFETGNGEGAVLIETAIEIKDNSVTAEKLLAENPAGATDPLAGKVATADANGNVTYEAITPASLIDKKTLTGDGITVTAGTTVGTDSSVADALLADVTLGIANGAVTTAKLADGAVTNQKLADGAVSSDKMTSFTDDNGTTSPVAAGHVPVADGSGNVTYQNVATAIGKDLTTDGKIVIVDGADEVNSLADAVFVATELKIAAESITSGDIKDGTIQVNDIKAPGTTTDSSTGGTENQVMVTNANGDVSWIDQSALGNKDSYAGIGAIDITENGTSTNGINYDVSVATATGTTLGVVKEAAAPTVNINTAGELVVNLDNTVLDGDVTGPLNATKVEKIQGTSVSDTDPTDTNNVLVYNDSTKEWTPTELTGSHIKGEELTSNSITVTPATGTTNAALLEELNIEITPATEKGLVLTTTGTAGNLTTSWEKPTASYSTTNVNIAGDTNYSPYIAEIILTVQLGNSDETVAFPTASAENEGQTISIKITNDNEAHTGYLNVLDTYGSMPYQGWIVKSNGSEWIIVGRN